MTPRISFRQRLPGPSEFGNRAVLVYLWIYGLEYPERDVRVITANTVR